MFNINDYKHVIWDFNGTLLDDTWLFVDIMNSILSNQQMNTIDLDEYREIFCFPIKNYYLSLGFNVNDNSFKQSNLEFIKKYNERRYDAKLFSNTKNILFDLSKKNITQSILSAQNQSLLNDLTKFYQIRGYFTEIYGVNNFHALGKIERGLELLKRLNINKNEILIIGDTIYDYDVATKLEIRCLLTSQGHQNFRRLKNTDAHVIRKIDSIADIFPGKSC